MLHWACLKREENIVTVHWMKVLNVMSQWPVMPSHRHTTLQKEICIYCGVSGGC